MITTRENENGIIEKHRVVPYTIYVLPLSVRAREILYWLLYESDRQFVMSRKEMAEKFGCSASSVGRYFKQFQKFGFLKTKGRVSGSSYEVNQEYGRSMPIQEPVSVEPDRCEEASPHSERPSSHSVSDTIPDTADTRWKLENHKPEDRLKVLLEVHEQDWQASYPLLGKHGFPTVRELVAEVEAKMDKSTTAHRSLMAVESKLYFTHLGLKEKLGLDKPKEPAPASRS